MGAAFRATTARSYSTSPLTPRGSTKKTRPASPVKRFHGEASPWHRPGVCVLAASTHTPGLCPGDASPWNLLTGDAGRVFLVDPRGVSGEVEYDLAVVALKAAPIVPAQETVPYLAALVGIEPGRARAWLAVASSARV